MVLRTSIGLVPVVILAHAVATLGDLLPPKDGGSAFSSGHGLGYSEGVLYLHTGDTIYTVDVTDPNDPLFTSHMTGLRSAFGGGPRAFEGSFATAPGGAAMVNMGFTSGGVLSVDLDAKTTAPVLDFDDDNIFSTAGRADQTFYATFVDPNFTTFTLLYHIDPNTLATQQVVDSAAGTGDASGGLAFDSNGDLIAGTFDFLSGAANFFRIDAADLAAFETSMTIPPVVQIGSGAANGTVNIVVDQNGLIFFNTTTGIGLLDPAASTVQNFYRDILDPNLFNYDGFKLPLNGLAYDGANHQLVFAEYDFDLEQYDLVFLAVPEPTTYAVFLIAGLTTLLRVRQTRRVRR